MNEKKHHCRDCAFYVAGDTESGICVPPDGAMEQTGATDGCRRFQSRDCDTCAFTPAGGGCPDAQTDGGRGCPDWRHPGDVKAGAGGHRRSDSAIITLGEGDEAWGLNYAPRSGNDECLLAMLAAVRSITGLDYQEIIRRLMRVHGADDMPF